MKREHFNAWLTKRVEFQRKITIGACAGMAALGLLAFIVEGGILYLIFSAAYGSKMLGAAIVLAIFGAMGAFTWMTAPGQLKDVEHEIHSGFEPITVTIAPTLASAWTFAFGSLDSDQSFPQRIANLIMIVPRLLWTSWYVYGRIQHVSAIDVESCGKVIRMLLKRSERVSADEVAEKFKSMDIPQTLRQLSFIDGVVFLTKESVGMSLANRFKEDLEEGLSRVDPTLTSDTPFGG